MPNPKKTRIYRSETVLSGLVKAGETFHIGVAFTPELVANTDAGRFGVSTSFNEHASFKPKAAGPNTKANVNGKYVRKQPEEKEDVKRHISYRRKKDGVQVKYDRIFSIYKKELKHRYDIELTFAKDAEGNELIISPALVYDETMGNNERNTHIINVFLEVFRDYEVLRQDLEPFIRFERGFDREILPAGTLANSRNFEDLVSIASRHVKEEEKEPLLQRLEVFKEFDPIIRQGPSGYSGYITFVFEDKGIVAAESIRRGNATYFFRLEDYERNVIKDKQEVLRDKLMLARFSHYYQWEQNVRRYLNKH